MIADLTRLAQRALVNATEWTTDSPYQKQKTAGLRDDLTRLVEFLTDFDPATASPYNAIFEWGEQNLSLEGQEQLVSLLIEGHGALVDDLAMTMSADETSNLSH